MRNQTRVPTNYAVTREQKRYIAKLNMKKANKKQFCKHSYISVKKGNFVESTRIPSYFSEHWKEFLEVSA